MVIMDNMDFGMKFNGGCRKVTNFRKRIALLIFPFNVENV